MTKDFADGQNIDAGFDQLSIMWDEFESPRENSLVGKTDFMIGDRNTAKQRFRIIAIRGPIILACNMRFQP